MPEGLTLVEVQRIIQEARESLHSASPQSHESLSRGVIAFVEEEVPSHPASSSDSSRDNRVSLPPEPLAFQKADITQRGLEEKLRIREQELDTCIRQLKEYQHQLGHAQATLSQHTSSQERAEERVRHLSLLVAGLIHKYFADQEYVTAQEQAPTQSSAKKATRETQTIEDPDKFPLPQDLLGSSHSAHVQEEYTDVGTAKQYPGDQLSSTGEVMEQGGANFLNHQAGAGDMIADIATDLAKIMTPEEVQEEIDLKKNQENLGGEQPREKKVHIGKEGYTPTISAPFLANPSASSSATIQTPSTKLQEKLPPKKRSWIPQSRGNKVVPIAESLISASKASLNSQENRTDRRRQLEVAKMKEQQRREEERQKRIKERTAALSK